MGRSDQLGHESQIFEPMSLRYVIALGMAPVMPIAPPTWLGYAGYSLWLVIGLGFLVTLFAFFLAQSDGMMLRLSKHGIRAFTLTYLQITAVLMTFFFIGTVVKH